MKMIEQGQAALVVLLASLYSLVGGHTTTLRVPVPVPVLSCHEKGQNETSPSVSPSVGITNINRNLMDTFKEIWTGVH